MSAAVPGPKTRSHCSTSPATPSASGRGRDLLAQPGLHRGPARPGGGPPAVVRRPHDRARPRTAWSTPGDRPAPAHPTTCLRRRRSTPRARGSRRAAPTTWPPARRTAPPAPARRPRDSQRSPLRCSPAVSTSRMSRRRSTSATRLLAPAWAKLSVSRGKTNRVRRIARCLTSDRSTYRASLQVGHRHAVDARPGGQVDRRGVGPVQADHAARPPRRRHPRDGPAPGGDDGPAGLGARRRRSFASRPAGRHAPPGHRSVRHGVKGTCAGRIG